jgi:hypothetical protein
MMELLIGQKRWADSISSPFFAMSIDGRLQIEEKGGRHKMSWAQGNHFPVSAVHLVAKLDVAQYYPLDHMSDRLIFLVTRGVLECTPAVANL